MLDLDDTLYLERDFVMSGFTAVGKAVEKLRGCRDFFSTARDLFVEGERRNIIDQAVELLNLEFSQAEILDLVQVYRLHSPDISLLPDALDFLDSIKDLASIGLITDGLNLTQWNKIEALGIRNRFDEIVVTGDYEPDWVKPGKPAYEYLQQAFNADPIECIYIADNIAKDFIAPKSLGWQTLRVKRPGGIYSHLTDGESADYEVKSLNAREIKTHEDLHRLILQQ